MHMVAGTLGVWSQQVFTSEIAGSRDPPEVELAEANYCQALALTEAFGMRPNIARCRLGLDLLHARVGRDRQARTSHA